MLGERKGVILHRPYHRNLVTRITRKTEGSTRRKDRRKHLPSGLGYAPALPPFLECGAGKEVQVRLVAWRGLADGEKI